jgi:hypothetical protein
VGSRRYQFQSPSSLIDAGRNTARMIVASIRTATARPMPDSDRAALTLDDAVALALS